jgi:hypothetical protein
MVIVSDQTCVTTVSAEQEIAILLAREERMRVALSTGRITRMSDMILYLTHVLVQPDLHMLSLTFNNTPMKQNRS